MVKTTELDDARKLAEKLVKDAKEEQYQYRGKTYGVHPAARIFPLIEGEPFAELVADVKASGVVEPVTVCGGVVLDGRNRLRAAIEAGVTVTIKELDSSASPIAFVVSKNLRRRDLKPAQRAYAARALRALSAAGPALEEGSAAGSGNGSGRAAPSSGGSPLPAGPGSSAPVPAGPGSAAPVPAGPGAGPGTPVVQRPSAEALSGAGAGPAKGRGEKRPGGPPKEAPLAPAPSRDPGELKGAAGAGASKPFADKVAGPAGGAVVDPVLATEKLGVSERSMQRLERIVREAPEYEELIKSGKVGLKEAEASEVAAVAPEVRKKAAELVDGGKAGTLREAVSRVLEESGGEPKKRKTPAPRKAAAGKKSSSKTAAGSVDADLEHTVLPKLPPAGQSSGRPPGFAQQSPDEAPAFEVYSPPVLIAAARVIMGAIELDPASSPEAQKSVEATKWYGPEHENSVPPWEGKVYLFPPLHRVADFADKLKLAILQKGVKEAVFLGPSETGATWAQDFMSMEELTIQVHRRGDEPLETEPRDGSKKRGKWRARKGLTAFVFGVLPTEQVVDYLSNWGFVFRRSGFAGKAGR